MVLHWKIVLFVGLFSAVFLALLAPSAKADAYGGTANLSFPSGSSFQFQDLYNGAFIIFNVQSGALEGLATWQETNQNGTITVTPSSSGSAAVSYMPTGLTIWVYLNNATYMGEAFSFTDGTPFTIYWNYLLENPLLTPFRLSPLVPLLVRSSSILAPLFVVAYMYSRINSADSSTERIREGLLTLLICLLMPIVFFSLWYLAVALDAMV